MMLTGIVSMLYVRYFIYIACFLGLEASGIVLLRQAVKPRVCDNNPRTLYVIIKRKLGTEKVSPDID